LRPSVADFEVVAELAGSAGRPRYLCNPPDRLDLRGEQVMVTELAAGPATWSAVAGRLAAFAAVGSDNLLRLLEVGEDPDPDGLGAYAASEAPAGELVAESGTLGTARAARAVAEAAMGAHALHEAGVAHGSISASTIHLTSRGGVLAPPCVDCPDGLVARIAGWRELETVDPDLFSGGLPSRSSDIWSLGATLHGLLSARPLHPGIDGDQPVTAVQRLLFTNPEVDPRLPRVLADVISSCLDADPAARPTTAAVLSELILGATEDR
jgi:eukaryotic-like serine/threonine-protein kinase